MSSSTLVTMREGEQTCSSIGEIHYLNTDGGNVVRRLDGWTCNTSSEVRITLRETARR